MLILFDHGTPRGLVRALADHTIITAKARGWDKLNNGDLLNTAEAAAVNLLLTTDQGIRVFARSVVLYSLGRERK